MSEHVLRAGPPADQGHCAMTVDGAGLPLGAGGVGTSGGLRVCVVYLWCI